MRVRVEGFPYSHQLVLRKCRVCGKKFIRYNKGKQWCSDKCEKISKDQYYRDRWLKVKASPALQYKYHRTVIERREAERRAKIRKDLPNIKRALKQGDEALVDYIFDHYGLLGKPRKYRKSE